jgi:hypothetical protein
MLFANLVFFSAFLMEGIGSYISIVGLSAIFSLNPVIIMFVISLDLAKIVGVSFLYKKWKKIPILMKIYMPIAAIVLMAITSSGTGSYLSAEFQKTILPTKGSDVMVNSMTDEKKRLEARKVEIDTQISNLPPDSIKGRQRLQKQFAGELDHINNRIVEIDKQLPELQIKQVEIDAHTGPITYIAKAFGVSIEDAVKYVILLLMTVFEPLAISLLIAGNFLIEEREEPKKKEPESIPEITESDPVETEPEPLIDKPSDNAEDQSASQKKKRGRKPKIESEPKPKIVSEDQLEDSPASFEPVLDFVENVTEEPTPVDVSSLTSVNHDLADVKFDNDNWKPSKNVSNSYL